MPRHNGTSQKTRDIKQLSRKNWQLSKDMDEPGIGEIKTGAILRIADSLENMEKPFIELLADAKRYRQWWQEERAENEALNRKIHALKGVITRKNNHISELKNQDQ